MLRRTLLRLSVSLAVVSFLATAAGLGAQQDDSKWGRKYKVPPLASRIEVTVLKSVNGKPIENAAVIFHPIEGDKDKGALELKTNEDGKAIIDVIPIGDTVRLQIIANGYQTYGQDYKIDKAEMSMEVHLKRPGAQYSIYKSDSATAGSGGNSGASSGSDKSATPPANAAPPAGSGKGAGSSAKPADSNTQQSSQPQTH
ncbi:MAG: hypothetical protein WBX18_08550 [Terracidiphilus sp.]